MKEKEMETDPYSIYEKWEAMRKRYNWGPASTTCEMLGDIGDLVDEIGRLYTAIRTHMNVRGDDRCYLDDAALYAILPEGDTRPPQDTAVTIENCRRYIECRQQGREYISPERELERLRGENEILKKEVQHFHQDNIRLWKDIEALCLKYQYSPLRFLP